MEAKIVGGANMFPNLRADLGSENIRSAKEKLDREHIGLTRECVGGSAGRSVEFCTATGVVTVMMKF
jgi:chemotaxis receptor (MCP) glutamine deamidase CheD